MASPVQLIIRNTIFPVLVHSGLHRLIWPTDDSILVLMYHGVNRTGYTTYNGRHISAARFEKHLKYLKANFEILSLKDAYDQVGSIPSGKPRVAVTFDDGFENNLNYASPLLQKYEVPATVFVSSICVSEEDNILWADVIDIALKDVNSVTVIGYEFKRTLAGMFNEKLGMTLQEFVKSRDRDERDAIISEISHQFDLESLKTQIDTEFWKLMNSAQVKALSENPLIEIGSHCHNHYNLASLSEQNAKHELQHSKELLENCIGRTVECIAYPDGSYNSDVKKWTYEAGYKRLCAVSFKLSEDESDPRILKRSAVSSTTTNYSNIIHFHKHFRLHGN